MTDLHIALKAAGVKLPSQLERIWVWLKDHQPQSARQIEITLKIPQASSILSQMETRRMVSSVKELDRSSGFTTKRFSVVGRTYELLPKPKKTPFKAAAPAAPVINILDLKPGPIMQAPQIVSIDTRAPWQIFTPAAPLDLDALTIAEARALYIRLASMFKGEAS